MRDDLDIPMPAMGPSGGSTASYRVPRHREGMDPNTKRLAMIAAGIGGTLVVLLGAWSFTGHRRSGVPVIEADSRPLRVKPDNAGGMQVAGKDEAILSGKADGQATLAPATEAPAPLPVKPPEPAPTVVATTPAAPAAPAVVESAPPAKPVAPTVTAIAPAPRTATPAKPATAQPAPSQLAMAQPAPKTAPAAPQAAKPAAPAVAPSAPPAAAPPAAAKPAATVAAGKGAMVQFAAVGSEQSAMTEWQRIEKKAPDLLSSRKPAVSKTEHDGKTFWRLRTGGFADTNAAKSFCEQAKTKGLTCAVIPL